MLLTLTEYVLVRVVNFDHRVMATEDLCHRIEWKQRPDLICLTVKFEVDHFNNKCMASNNMLHIQCKSQDDKSKDPH